jgi:hypothetical protein
MGSALGDDHVHGLLATVRFFLQLRHAALDQVVAQHHRTNAQRDRHAEKQPVGIDLGFLQRHETDPARFRAARGNR